MIAYWGNHYEWKTKFNSQHNDTEQIFWTRMRVVEDKEGKTCPSYYQSTRPHYSEETGGVPIKHKCWDGVGRT